jgi:hypothetical protein
MEFPAELTPQNRSKTLTMRLTSLLNRRSSTTSQSLRTAPKYLRSLRATQRCSRPRDTTEELVEPGKKGDLSIQFWVKSRRISRDLKLRRTQATKNTRKTSKSS